MHRDTIERAALLLAASACLALPLAGCSETDDTENNASADGGGATDAGGGDGGGATDGGTTGSDGGTTGSDGGATGSDGGTGLTDSGTTVKPPPREPVKCDDGEDAAFRCFYPMGLPQSLYNPSKVMAVCGDEGTRNGTEVEDCGFGTICFDDDQNPEIGPRCARSVTANNADKPYYNHSCGVFSQWMRYPTGLEIDCRCRTTSDGTGSFGGTGSAYADPNNIDIDNGGHPAGAIINCAGPGGHAEDRWPVDYGEGPNFGQWSQEYTLASWRSGVLDPNTRELFALIEWTSDTNNEDTNAGTLVAWNVDTGDRRVVSGKHPDSRAGLIEYGSGYLSPQGFLNRNAVDKPKQILTRARVLRMGPDRKLYASSGYEIIRVDPASGAREIVWRAQFPSTGELKATYGQCFRPDNMGREQSVEPVTFSFEVAPDGSFYQGFGGTGTREGNGIMKISADGSTCTPVSRWNARGHAAQTSGQVDAPAPPDIGQGFDIQFEMRGLLWHDGKLYATSGDEMYEFDVATGNRLKITAGDGYDGMGESNMFWDPSRQVIWAVGREGSTYLGAIVEPMTGQTESIYGDVSDRKEYGNDTILRSVYPNGFGIKGVLQNGNSLNAGAVALDPKDNNIVYAVAGTGALIKIELSTYNSYIMSW